MEDQSVASCCDAGGRHPRDREGGESLHVRNLRVSTVSDSGAHHPPAIVTGKVMGQDFRHGVPITCRVVHQVALTHLARSVLEPCRPAELFEPRDRAVRVCVVEHFTPVDEVTIDCQYRDPAPLGGEALVRRLMRRVSDDCSVASSADALARHRH